MPEPIPLIIDSDPGLDDAVALLLALASPELELLGVSTVAGNAPLARCNDNALKICELAGRADVGVYAGCPGPILRPLTTAAAVHGASGIGGVTLPAPRLALQPAHGVDFIIDTLRAGGDLTLCPLGPLTNLALAFVKAPDILTRIRRIVLMGGAMERGNITPAAEFNFYVDPHAAQVVLASGVPVVMFGLDATHQALVTPARLTAIRDIGNPVAGVVADALASLPADQRRRYGGNPLHDPCVIAYLLRPELFAGRNCHVEVVTEAGLASGQSVVDWWGVTGRPANALVIDDVDADGFFALLAERLARYGSARR